MCCGWQLITAQTPADLTPFCKAFLNQLKKKRKVVHLTDGKTAKLANWDSVLGATLDPQTVKRVGKKLLIQHLTRARKWEHGNVRKEVFRCRSCDYLHVFHFGRMGAYIIRRHGSSVVKAGDTIVLPKGWTGRWDIQSESLRKVYVISED